MNNQIFKHLVLGLGFAVLGSAQIVVPPACSSLSTLIQIVDGSTCTLGDGFILKNGSFSSSSTGNEVLPGQINFSASYLAGVISIGLSGPFQTVLGETHTYNIGFLIDPPPEILNGFESDVDWGSTTNALSTQAGTGLLGIDLCAGASFLRTGCPANQRTYSSSPATPRGGATFPPTNIVDVNLFLTLADGGQLNSIFTRTQSTLNAIPEPSVGLVAGALALGLLVRRRR